MVTTQVLKDFLQEVNNIFAKATTEHVTTAQGALGTPMANDF